MNGQRDPEGDVTGNCNGQEMLPDIACIRMGEFVALRARLSQTNSSALTAAPSRTGVRACVSPSGREWERMEVRASLRAFEHGHDTHHQQRTNECRDHVVLRVPFIALTAQPL